MSRILSRLAVASMASLVALAGASAPAMAQTTHSTQVQRCKYPVLGNNAATIAWTVAAPDPVRDSSSIDLAVDYDTNDGVGEGIVVVDGTQTVKGKLTADLDVTFGDGSKRSVQATFPLTSATSPGGAPLLKFSGTESVSLGAAPQGLARIDVRRVGLNLTASRSDGSPVLLPPVTKGPDGEPVMPTDTDPSTFDAYCTLSAGESPRIAIVNVSDAVEAPCWLTESCARALEPTNPHLRSVAATTASVAWDPADDYTVKGYVVELGGVTTTFPTDSNSAELTGLEPETNYFGLIRAISRDRTAASSEPVSFTFRTTLSPTSTVPLPAERQAGDIGTTTATIRWKLGPGPVTDFELTTPQGLVKIPYTQLSLDLTGLKPDTDYEIPVRALGADGTWSKPLVIAFRTLPLVIPGGPTTVAYAATGSVSVATLVRGSLPLKGSALLTFGAPSPQTAVTGSLNLGQSQGRLVALGYLPVTAKISIVSTGLATGTYNGSALSLSQKVRLKVLEAKLFGAIPLAGGNGCQTKQLTDLNLKSSGAFDVRAGGTLSSTFKISDLNGCGPFNGLLSPATAGGGNTITVKLDGSDPVPVPAAS